MATHAFRAFNETETTSDSAPLAHEEQAKKNAGRNAGRREIASRKTGRKPAWLRQVESGLAFMVQRHEKGGFASPLG